MKRLVISSNKSGGGKTTVTCGLIRAFMKRGLRVSSRKCGPDYIDPMFHRRVLGIETGNLDPYFVNDKILRYLTVKGNEDCDVELIEGAMGYYDGVGGTTVRASTYEVARITGSPVVLVVDAGGVSVTLAAAIQGILGFKPDNNIQGIILNRVSAGFYERLKKLIEDECRVRVLGYLPALKEIEIGSRHLGLMQPGELEDIDNKLDILAEQLEKTVDLDGLLKIADTSEQISTECPGELKQLLGSREVLGIRKTAPVIAIARDEAFSFYYDDNIRLLEELGAVLRYFSPLNDETLPRGTNGIILYGGYPEENAERLSRNASMLEAIRSAYDSGIPVIAECGGFMYLMDELGDKEGRSFRMCGVVKDRAFYSGHLVRFGYMEATADKGGLYGEAGISFRGHEFHHWDCTVNGDDFTAHKPLSEKYYRCIVHRENLAAGFPHIYAYGNPEMYVNYLLKACEIKICNYSEPCTYKTAHACMNAGLYVYGEVTT